MKARISLLLLIGILLCVPAASADVYSWTDENGVKHFGQQPPENATNVELVFKEEPHDATTDKQRTATENKELTELIKQLEEEDQQQAAEDRKRAKRAGQNKKLSQAEKIANEKNRLEAKIAELEKKPLDYFGSQKNKRVRIGYYRYRLETLMSDPDKYFSEPEQFEGNVKPADQQ